MACTGPVGGLARAPLKMIATVPQTRALLRAAMAEVVKVAASQGVELDDNLEAALDRYKNGPVSTLARQRERERERERERDRHCGHQRCLDPLVAQFVNWPLVGTAVPI